MAVAFGLLIVLNGLNVAPAAAQSFQFTRLLDSSVRVPGATETFGWLWEASFDGTSVAFQGGGSFSRSGLYLYHVADGSIETGYDANTVVAGLPRGIRAIDQVALDDGIVVFRGWTERGALAFAYENGTLRIVVDQGGSVNYLSFHDGELAFTAGPWPESAYVGPLGGPYTLVATSGDLAMGGSGTVGQIFGVSSDGADLYLWAWSGDGDGIFRCHPSGSWELVYHGSDFGPLDPPFREFHLLQLDARDGQIGFYVYEFGSDVTSSGYVGLHTVKRGILEETIATGMPVPGRSDSFESTAGAYSLDQGHVVALGLTRDYHGIFTTLPGTLTEVVGTDDRLDGSDVHAFTISQDALAGSALVFTAWFQDGTRALYLAEWLGSVNRRQVVRPTVRQRQRRAYCGTALDGGRRRGGRR